MKRFELLFNLGVMIMSKIQDHVFKTGGENMLILIASLFERVIIMVVGKHLWRVSLNHHTYQVPFHSCPSLDIKHIRFGLWIQPKRRKT